MKKDSPGPDQRADQAIGVAVPQGAVVETLLVTDLVGSTRLVRQLGDERAAKMLAHHDRLARDVLAECAGREIDKTDGFLMLFERPVEALRFAIAYHAGLADLGREEGIEIRARVGIHVGEVILRTNPPEDVARGAKPVEVEGLAKSIAARLMSLAGAGQTLLTRGAFDLARRGTVGIEAEQDLRWLAHGRYRMAGFEEPIRIYEVGLEGAAPLAPPASSAKVRRLDGDEVLGWRPAIGLEVPQRPHWNLESKLGEGGFGEVWLAEHRKTRDRRVFKFCFDADRLRTLQREITIFRLLKEELGDRHDIVRILDWSFEHIPYFIESEYTTGGNLVEWAQHQGGLARIPLETRLELVAQTAEALAAAHSVGVLHKDVKPLNVLISTDTVGRPAARLTDFGIGLATDEARLAAAGITVRGLTERLDAGQESATSGTRMFMAPELIEGRAATVQADIYALGVLLYQMVVADFSRALAPGWRRDVEDELLEDDVAAAVDGSPRRRLAGALRLAERLRSLASRRRERDAECQAREQAEHARAALEQGRKQRKLAAAAVVGLTLFAGAMAIQAGRIGRERDRANSLRERADQEAETARRVSNFMVDLFRVSDPNKALGNSITAREILDRGAERLLYELTEQPAVQARLLHTAGRVYKNLGLGEDALPLLQKAVALREESLGREHPKVAQSLVQLGLVQTLLGRYPEAETNFRRALQVQEKVLGTEHPAVATSLDSLAILFHKQGRYAEVENLYRRALAIREKTLGSDHPDLASSLNNLAVLLLELRDFARAETLFQRALEVREDALGSDHPHVAWSLANLALLYREKGEDARAGPLYQRALESLEKTYGADHPNVAALLEDYADLQRRIGTAAATDDQAKHSAPLHPGLKEDP